MPIFVDKFSCPFVHTFVACLNAEAFLSATEAASATPLHARAVVRKSNLIIAVVVAGEGMVSACTASLLV
jgi:hypothetical protein